MPEIQEFDTPDSSSIKHVKYNPNNQVLTITFKSNGREYDFENITQKKFEEFLKAPSKGKYVVQLRNELKKKSSF